MSSGAIPFALSMVVLLIGLYAIIAKANVVKIIIGILITDYAVNLFLVLLGYRHGGRAPIVTKADLDTSGGVSMGFVNTSVDPVPQALILTSIVIGLAVAAMMVALALRLHDKYGTFDITRIRRLKG
ncbi:NADH-quinone oxidoreductase subunit K [Candidatus Fermentibacteria bacterium]|nr:NADH-quinone oxidoreductase subunit K [Candidatus Fermentibacteria bacterium]